MAPVEFEARRSLDKRLLGRTTALRRGGFLREHTFSRGSVSFLLDDISSGEARWLSLPTPRFYIASRDRSEDALAVAAQFSANYARMEIEDQSSTFARHLRNCVDGDGERLMVNRSKKRGSAAAAADAYKYSLRARCPQQMRQMLGS
ncbi:hypothetical protein PF004_g23791 [Phytophthora fragariae]|uniref:Uncharacterized protein n=1 Tax=Phytophthora fragariae TaxID=53985 RepID=A0A6G0MW23_9STRA|nr:hypothetical protein PF004_g23791 [Phytophthora fragariae]